MSEEEIDLFINECYVLKESEKLKSYLIFKEIQTIIL